MRSRLVSGLAREEGSKWADEKDEMSVGKRVAMWVGEMIVEWVAKKAFRKADASVDLMVPSPAAALLDFLTADQ